MSKNKTVTIIYRGKDIGGIIPFQHIENSLKTIKTFVEKTKDYRGRGRRV